MKKSNGGNRKVARKRATMKQRSPKSALEPGSVVLTPQAAQGFKELVEKTMELQAKQFDLCTDLRVELNALLPLLVAKGVVTEQEWERSLDNARKLAAGVSEAEILGEIATGILRKFDGPKQ
jgi:hypothetical protein